MTDRAVLMIDAGYLLAETGRSVTGMASRAVAEPHSERLIRDVIRQVEELSSARLLRTYWYDGCRNGIPTERHRAVGELNGVKLRLGRLSRTGEQKGVDILLALDILGVARERTAAVVYLVTGDDDLSEAVEQAQQMGVQVVLMAVGGSGTEQRIGVSNHLRLTVDSVVLLETELDLPAPRTDLTQSQSLRQVPRGRISRRIQPEVGDTESSQLEDALDRTVDAIASQCVNALNPEQLQQLGTHRPAVPSYLDSQLLGSCRKKLGGKELQPAARTILRKRFWEALDRLAEGLVPTQDTAPTERATS